MHVPDISYTTSPRWTQEQLKKVIAMLQDPAFDSKDIDPDLRKRMDKAVQDGSIKCFNMRESEADGDQDLHLWASELEDVVREIMEDPVIKGNQNFKFEMLSIIASHAESPADTIQDVGNVLCCSCTYEAVLCIYMFILITYYICN